MRPTIIAWALLLCGRLQRWMGLISNLLSLPLQIHALLITLRQSRTFLLVQSNVLKLVEWTYLGLDAIRLDSFEAFSCFMPRYKHLGKMEYEFANL